MITPGFTGISFWWEGEWYSLRHYEAYVSYTYDHAKTAKDFTQRINSDSGYEEWLGRSESNA